MPCSPDHEHRSIVRQRPRLGLAGSLQALHWEIIDQDMNAATGLRRLSTHPDSTVSVVQVGRLTLGEGKTRRTDKVSLRGLDRRERHLLDLPEADNPLPEAMPDDGAYAD